MQLLEPIDAHQFLKHGAARSSLPAVLADILTRRLEILDYVDMPSDHCDAGPRFRGLIEADNNVSTLLANLWRRLATEDMAELTKLFNSSPEDQVTTVLRLGDGYSLDWHNHLASKATSTLLIYLFSGDTPGTGGDLVLGELQPDLDSVRETQRLQISHGDVVLIGDMTHPLMQHKAERWTGDGWRYLLSYAFNSNDW